MDMVSISQFLNPKRPKPEDYVRFLQLLLQGVALHAVEGDESELGRFRMELSGIANRLNDRTSTEDILLAMGTVIRAISEYNRAATKVTRTHLHELQAMLTMMTGTIAFLSDPRKIGIEQLQNVERNLQKASAIEDIRVLRGKLDECLTTVRNETNQLRDESRANLAALRDVVDRATVHVRSKGVPQAVDMATGLLRRAAAEELIAEKISQGMEFVVAILVVDRLAHVNGHFGREAGDAVLLLVAQNIGQRLETGLLFRWNGPAFVAILEARPSFSAIEFKIKKIASVPLEKSLETDGRFMQLRVTCSFLVQMVSGNDSVDAVARNVDKFIASHVGKDPELDAA